MKPTLVVLHSDAGAAAIIDALKHWRQDYAPGLSYERLMGEAIQRVETKHTIYPHGQSEQTVWVRAKGTYRSDRYFYKASVVAGEVKLDRICD